MFSVPVSGQAVAVCDVMAIVTLTHIIYQPRLDLRTAEWKWA
jgi:hypothetical protein